MNCRMYRIKTSTEAQLLLPTKHHSNTLLLRLRVLPRERPKTLPGGGGAFDLILWDEQTIQIKGSFTYTFVIQKKRVRKEASPFPFCGGKGRLRENTRLASSVDEFLRLIADLSRVSTSLRPHRIQWRASGLNRLLEAPMKSLFCLIGNVAPSGIDTPLTFNLLRRAVCIKYNAY